MDARRLDGAQAIAETKPRHRPRNRGRPRVGVVEAAIAQVPEGARDPYCKRHVLMGRLVLLSLRELDESDLLLEAAAARVGATVAGEDCGLWLRAGTIGSLSVSKLRPFRIGVDLTPVSSNWRRREA